MSLSRCLKHFIVIFGKKKLKIGFYVKTPLTSIFHFYCFSKYFRANNMLSTHYMIKKYNKKIRNEYAHCRATLICPFKIGQMLFF